MHDRRTPRRTEEDVRACIPTQVGEVKAENTKLAGEWKAAGTAPSTTMPNPSSSFGLRPINTLNSGSAALVSTPSRLRNRQTLYSQSLTKGGSVKRRSPDPGRQSSPKKRKTEGGAVSDAEHVTSARRFPQEPEQQLSRRTPRKGFHDGPADDADAEEDELAVGGATLGNGRRANMQQKLAPIISDFTELPRTNDAWPVSGPSEYRKLEDSISSDGYVRWNKMKKTQDRLDAARASKSSPPLHEVNDIVSTRRLNLGATSAAPKNLSLPQTLLGDQERIRGTTQRVSSDAQSASVDLTDMTESPQDVSSCGERRPFRRLQYTSDSGPSQLQETRKQAANQGHSRLPRAKNVQTEQSIFMGSSAAERYNSQGNAHKFALSYVYFDGELVGNDLVLFLDVDGFQFYRGDQALGRVLPVSQIIRAMASEAPTGRRLRFGLRRDLMQVDLEVKDDNCFSSLVAELNTLHGDLKFKPDWWMEKAMSKRIVELEQDIQKRSRNTRDNVSESWDLLDDGVALAETHQRRRSSLRSETSPASGQASRAKITDLLHGYTSKTRDLTAVRMSTDADLGEPSRRRTYGEPRRTRASTRARSDGKVVEHSTVEMDQPVKPLPHDNGPEWKKPLVYPRDGKKKAIVEFEDLERLDDEQFLNDNLIGFYLRYLQDVLEQRSSEDAKRVYFFNTYFMEKLTGGKTNGDINYDAVKRWTRDTDLFSYDYIIIPVNEAAHWYVVVICNLPALFEDDLDQTLAEEEEYPEPTREEDHPKPVGSSPGHAITFEESQVSETRPRYRFLDQAPPRRTRQTAITAAKLTKHNSEQVTEVPASPSATASPTSRDADQQSHYFDMPRLSDDDPQIEAIASKAPLQQQKRRRKKRPSSRQDNWRRPAMIVLDSLRIKHPKAIKSLKAYLIQEAEEKRGNAPFAEGDIQGLNANGIPHQDNYCDCGLYLLGYMDKFIENPSKFVKMTLMKTFDEHRDWPDLQPAQMRQRIRELIQGLHREQMGLKKASKSKLPRISDPNGPSDTGAASFNVASYAAVEPQPERMEILPLLQTSKTRSRGSEHAAPLMFDATVIADSQQSDSAIPEGCKPGLLPAAGLRPEPHFQDTQRLDLDDMSHEGDIPPGTIVHPDDVDLLDNPLTSTGLAELSYTEQLMKAAREEPEPILLE